MGAHCVGRRTAREAGIRNDSRSGDNKSTFILSRVFSGKTERIASARVGFVTSGYG